MKPSEAISCLQQHRIELPIEVRSIVRNWNLWSDGWDRTTPSWGTCTASDNGYAGEVLCTPMGPVRVTRRDLSEWTERRALALKMREAVRSRWRSLGDITFFGGCANVWRIATEGSDEERAIAETWPGQEILKYQNHYPEV